MSKLHIQIMFYLDKHLDGNELTWKGYDNLINLIFKEHSISDDLLEAKVLELTDENTNLRRLLCLSLSREQIKQGKQLSRKKSRKG